MMDYNMEDEMDEVIKSYYREIELRKRRDEDICHILNRVSIMRSYEADYYRKIIDEIAEVINLPLSYYEREGEFDDQTD